MSAVNGDSASVAVIKEVLLQRQAAKFLSLLGSDSKKVMIINSMTKKPIQGHGNATQSKIVNNLINVMKRAETQGTGQETVADRAFNIVEC